ncbi:hypothetical protein LTS09_000715 [Friedmanniomyces endolithicus]|nr:hypothetical protein LTS09_000715 [Friedmanniomyces endolithicus]
MGLLKHFRSKSRLAGPQPTHTSTAYNSPPTPYRGRDHTQRLPDPVLALILAYVCPHTQDSSYLPSERSQIDSDGCMLCDLRDLAHCAAVSRKWYSVSQKALYGSVRIDAVHYCALEEELAQRRRKGGGKGMHFRSKSSVLTVEPGEVPSVRLSLLCRTVRESEFLAHKVLVLKLPYMTRETAKGELARCVSALPNLRYVDLPDGFFTGDPSCLALRQELQARCPDIRKMSYRPGSEDALELLALLASLPTLRVLTLSEMDWLDDSIFQPSPGQLPDFPPVQSLRLESTPGVTAEGLSQWLSVPHNREALTSISLQSTGVTVQDLHQILWQASQVQHLSISEIVSKSLSLASTSLPPLTSISLRTLHFEITSSEDVHGLQKPAESYYAYLASSLHQNALPALETLYVRDPDFPELLLLPPVTQPFATSDNGGMNASSLRSKPSDLSSYTNNSLHNGPKGTASNTRGALAGTGFNQTLEVFSKGLDELEWVFTSIAPTPSPSWDPTTPTALGRTPPSPPPAAAPSPPTPPAAAWAPNGHKEALAAKRGNPLSWGMDSGGFSRCRRRRCRGL